MASGLELVYGRDRGSRGVEFAVLLGLASIHSTEYCAEFVDSTRQTIIVEDHLQFNRDIRRYEVFVKRQTFLSLRYSKLAYSKSGEWAFRKSLGYRLTRWRVETSSRAYVPASLLSFDGCGHIGGLGIVDLPDRFQGNQLEASFTRENRPFVHSLEAGLGASYRTAFNSRLLFATELNTFVMLHLNKAELGIASPTDFRSNYTMTTTQQFAFNLDFSIGLLWRL